MNESKPAIFLDRDGTINEEVDYLSDAQQLRLVVGAAKAIRIFNQLGFKSVVVTNQAGIARGYFDEDALKRIHARLLVMLADEDARLDAIYYCPHHPTNGLGSYLVDCGCRKPKPGMLVRAASELNLNLEQSYMIGDKKTDLEAGFAATCRGILVRTGYGHEAEKQYTSTDRLPDFVADNLLESARWISKQ